MRNTVFGVCLDATGLAARREFVRGRDGPELRFNAWSSSSLEVRRTQAPRIAVDLGHDEFAEIGEVIHLERHPQTRALWAVAHINSSIREAALVKVGGEVRSVAVPLYFSAESDATLDGRDILVRAIAVTTATARVSAGPPLRILPGELDHRDAPRRWNLPSGYQRDLLRRAAATASDRRAAGAKTPIIVHDENAETGTGSTGLFEAVAPGRPIEYRSAELADVSTAGRSVQIIAAPYGIEASVPFEGRTVRESFSNTAFIRVNEQTNVDRIRVWRDHRPEHVVGRVVDLNPFDAVGLIAEFRLSRTRLGDETLALAEDGALDASVGFRVLQDRWEGRSRRRVTAAWLHHLGLTSDPAYDGTFVLAVGGSDTLH